VPRHYAPTKRSSGVVVLFHGFSACPQQYDVLGPLIAAEGFDVLLPLTPGHGNALNMSHVHGVCIEVADAFDPASLSPLSHHALSHTLRRVATAGSTTSAACPPNPPATSILSIESTASPR
jgi:alpha-beta hydrolase superfamily lysophospholipase